MTPHRRFGSLQANETFLRGEEILRNVFSIEWSFGVGWALAGEIEKVAANVKRMQGRDERHRRLTGLAVDVLKTGDHPGQNVGIARQIASLAVNPIDVTVVTLDIAARTVRLRACMCMCAFVDEWVGG